MMSSRDIILRKLKICWIRIRRLLMKIKIKTTKKIRIKSKTIKTNKIRKTIIKTKKTTKRIRIREIIRRIKTTKTKEITKTKKINKVKVIKTKNLKVVKAECL